MSRFFLGVRIGMLNDPVKGLPHGLKELIAQPRLSQVVPSYIAGEFASRGSREMK